MIIGRKEELQELKSKYDSKNFELGIVYGARRIGKTTILNDFSNTVNGFMYQAKNAELAINLHSFSRSLRKYLGFNDNLEYKTFEDAFDDIAKYAKTKKFVLIIDEFSYLCEKSQSLISILQSYVDHQFRESQMMIVLSGSNVSFMKELLNNKTNALYKRETFQIDVKKMPFSEALGFLTGLSNTEKESYLALFSTSPYYLGMIDKTKSFDDNLQQLLFSKFGTLLDAPDTVLPVGVSKTIMYTSILYQISKGKNRIKDLALSLKVEPNYLSPYINSLLEMETIERRSMLDSGFKNNYYAISDSLLDFYYQFIFDYRDYIELGGGSNYYKSIKENIQNFLALGFERVVISYMTEKNLKGELDQPYGLIQNYKVENSKLGRSIEIDGLAESINKTQPSLLAIECKYRNKNASLEVLNHLKESVSVFEKYHNIQYYLFSKTGFSDDIKQVNEENVHLITLDSMFKKN